MGKGLLFFCCSCCILVLTIINLSVGPIVSGAEGNDWGLKNCKLYKDTKDNAEDLAKANGIDLPDEMDKRYQSVIDFCTRAKGMYDMEYTAFIFDIVIGFVCGLIGLLHLFDLKKDFVSNTGLIGLICGIVGFALTFVYVIFNGLIFTGKYTSIVERDGDGIFAEGDPSTHKYKCLNYDKEDNFYGRAKLSDLNKKQYNYKHDFYDDEAEKCEDKNNIYQNCIGNGESTSISDNGNGEEFTLTLADGNVYSNGCKYIYAGAENGIKNKDKFDRFLTALILSLIVCLANIGLALFGFLLFRTPGDF